jgi:excisionase family DNA binding protein
MILYTLEEVSEILKIEVQTARKLIDSGLLKAKNIGTGERNIYRVSLEDLQEFINQ